MGDFCRSFDGTAALATGERGWYQIAGKIPWNSLLIEELHVESNTSLRRNSSDRIDGLAGTT
jgi:hypothetical protein